MLLLHPFCFQETFFPTRHALPRTRSLHHQILEERHGLKKKPAAGKRKAKAKTPASSALDEVIGTWSATITSLLDLLCHLILIGYSFGPGFNVVFVTEAYNTPSLARICTYLPFAALSPNTGVGRFEQR